MFSLRGIGIILSLFFVANAWAAAGDSTSYVSEATVFKDRAYVKRHQDLNFEKGPFTVTFNGITPLADPDSLKVVIADHVLVKVMGIRHEKKFFAESRNKQLVEVKAERDLLDQQRQKLMDAAGSLNHERENLDLLSAHYSDSFSLNLHQNSWTRAGFQSFMNFWSSRNQADQNAWFHLFTEYDALSKKIEFADNKITELSTPSDKETLTVFVDVVVKDRVRSGVDLQYMVTDAGWSPSYDLRVDPQNNVASLEQHAYVWQNSGEDWTNIKLSLSNFREALNTNAPNISPVTISYRDVSKVQTTVGGKVEEAQDLDVSPASADTEKPEGEDGISQTFEIPGRHTLKDGSKKSKIFVAQKTLPYKEHLELVAAQYPKVFRKGELVNKFPWSLAAGTMYVYYDGSYIDQNWLESVPQGKTFGINGGVEHNLVVSYWETDSSRNPSQLSSTRHFFKEVHTRIENFDGESRQIKILQQMPVSELGSVKVDYSTPDDQKELKKDSENEGWYFWQVAVAPRKVENLSVKLDVSVPKDFDFHW